MEVLTLVEKGIKQGQFSLMHRLKIIHWGFLSLVDQAKYTIAESFMLAGWCTDTTSPWDRWDVIFLFRIFP